MTKQCAIYTRVSTENQAKKEFSSCQAQEEKIRSFVKSQNNWKTVKVYSDAGYSGANTNRPALQQMLSDFKKEKINLVLVYKIDRLTRSPKDFYQLIEFFEQAKIDFISITERFDTSTPAGRLLRNIMLTFAQFERELVSERVKDKMLERARKGMWNGGLIPFGYQNRNKKLIPHPKEAEIIKSIFETYLETKSLSQVYQSLRKRNITTRQGSPFYKTIIGYILRNKIYIGKITYGKNIYQGLHQPIISEEVFDFAQKIHQNKKKKLRVYKNFLFGGLVECKECGSKMTSCFTNKRTNNKLKRYYYYRCTSTSKKDWQACSVKQVNAERLENFCIENLERISLDKNYLENLVFRLNAPRRIGHELSKACSKFSSDRISSTLKFFLSFLKNRKGIEKNLWVKKFIKKILYTPETIKILLYYPKKYPAPQLRGRETNLKNQKESQRLSENKEFALYKQAPHPVRNPNLFQGKS